MNTDNQPTKPTEGISGNSAQRRKLRRKAAGKKFNPAAAKQKGKK